MFKKSKIQQLKKSKGKGRWKMKKGIYRKGFYNSKVTESKHLVSLYFTGQQHILPDGTVRANKINLKHKKPIQVIVIQDCIEKPISFKVEHNKLKFTLDMKKLNLDLGKFKVKVVFEIQTSKKKEYTEIDFMNFVVPKAKKEGKK